MRAEIGARAELFDDLADAREVADARKVQDRKTNQTPRKHARETCRRTSKGSKAISAAKFNQKTSGGRN
jgi:hypothetical protein